MEHEPTIRISVRISGHLRKFSAGERDLTLPRTSTVRDLLAVLAESSAELKAVLFTPSGEPAAQLLLFVDDEQSDAGTSLSNARSVTLMLPISGG